MSSGGCVQRSKGTATQPIFVVRKPKMSFAEICPLIRRVLDTRQTTALKRDMLAWKKPFEFAVMP